MVKTNTLVSGLAYSPFRLGRLQIATLQMNLVTYDEDISHKRVKLLF